MLALLAGPRAPRPSSAPRTAGSRRVGCGRASSTSTSLGLRRRLDGLRVGHLSDFHLGAPLSRGNRASVRAVEWVAARRPDLVCVTGDLVSHPRGERRLRSLLDLLEHPYVVLGNHDVAVTRDPFSRTAELRDLEAATLLRDEAATILVRGERVSVVGVDPETYRGRTARPESLVDTDVAFRLLLCHFPANRPAAARALVRPDPRRPPPRGPDLRPVLRPAAEDSPTRGLRSWQASTRHRPVPCTSRRGRERRSSRSGSSHVPRRRSSSCGVETRRVYRPGYWTARGVAAPELLRTKSALPQANWLDARASV